MPRRIAVVLALLLLTILVAPASALGGGCHSEAPASERKATGDVTVHISKCAFSPTVLYVEEGTSVTWKSHDPMPHTVTGSAGGIAGMTELYAGDDTGPIAFDETGVFPYACILHPGMVGAVVVGDLDDAMADAGTLESDAALSAAEQGTPPSGGAGLSAMSIALGSLITLVVAAAALIVWRRTRGAIVPEEGSALQH